MERRVCSPTPRPSAPIGPALARWGRTSSISPETCGFRRRSFSSFQYRASGEFRNGEHAMRDLQSREKWEGRTMSTTVKSSPVFFLAAFFFVVLFLALPVHAQNVQVDLSSTSALCGGQECFNTAGLFANGKTFLGTTGMDDGNNCTPTAPYTNCPDAYSAQQLFGSSFSATATTPPTLTLGGVPFTFGTVNTASCGSTGAACIDDVVNFTSGGVTLTLPA